MTFNAELREKYGRQILECWVGSKKEYHVEYHVKTPAPVRTHGTFGIAEVILSLNLDKCISLLQESVFSLGDKITITDSCARSRYHATYDDDARFYRELLLCVERQYEGKDQ